jgi:hypothetical protein
MSHTKRTQTPAPTPRGTFFVHTYTPHATRTIYADFLITELLFPVGRDSSVGVETRYGLDDQGIEFRWGRDFSLLVQTSPGAHPASCTMGTSPFPGD